jgi:hypothetical protein
MFNMTLGTVLLITLISGIGVSPVMAFAGVYLIAMSIIHIMFANERF